VGKAVLYRIYEMNILMIRVGSEDKYEGWCSDRIN
jgi:hypothetical protein